MIKSLLLLCILCAFAQDEAPLAFIGRTRDTTGDGLIDVDDAGRLFIARPGGEAPIPLTGADMDVMGITWSPDRQHLAFSAHYTDTTGDGAVTRSDNASIFVVAPTADAEARALTGADTHDRFPTWSPDGRQIAFASSDGAHAAIEILPADCAEAGCADARRAFARGEGAYLDLAWSPEGQQIAFLALRDTRADGVLNRLEDAAALYLLEAATGALVELAPGDGPMGGPVWSPDGQHLAYYAFSDTDGDGFTDPFYDHAGVFVIDMAAPDPAPYRITGAQVHATDPAWAPGGGLRLAYGALTDSNGDGWLDAASDSADIFLAEFQNGAWQAAQPLTGPETLDYAPAWSPDGAQIAYVSFPAADGGGVGMAVNRRGGVFVAGRRVSPEGMDAFGPVWR